MEDGVRFKPNPQDRKKVSRYVRLNNRISVVNTINLVKAFIVILCFVLFVRRRNYYRDRHEDFEAKKYAPALIRQGDNKKTSPLKLEGESPLSIEKNLLKSSTSIQLWKFRTILIPLSLLFLKKDSTLMFQYSGIY